MNKLKTALLASTLAVLAAALSHANGVAAPAAAPNVIVNPPNGQLPPTTKLLQLNDAIVDLLQPFNTADTKAKVNFGRVETNADRALAMSASVDYAKRGPNGSATVTGSVDYDYPVGGVPRTKADLNLGFNVLNVVEQRTINQFGPMADKMVAGFAQDFLSEYGQAAAVNAKVTRRDVDAAGNLTAIAVDLNAKIDLSRVPAAKQASVMFAELGVKLEITLAGASLKIDLVTNPAHSSFARDQDGLKERLEKLLARDADQMDEIRSMIRMFDQFAGQVTRKQTP